ncbi:MAG: cytochrome P450 [Cryomorphaceae bacterium]|jgi:cytochrome P450
MQKARPKVISMLNFDPLSAEFAQDPYSIYASLRAMEEPYYHAKLDIVLLSRYTDVSEITLNENSVRSLDGYLDTTELKQRQRDANWHDMPYHERFVQFSLLDSDGEIHHRLRKQIFNAFTARSVNGLENDIQAYVDATLSNLSGRDTVDFIEDFAAHIPGLVIGKLLGVPKDDAPQLRIWSEEIVRFFDVDRSDIKKRAAETATHQFHDYLVRLKDSRTKNPCEDLISKMIIDDESGAYAPDEFISTCMLILLAGHGSTIDVLGSGMHTLIQRPTAMSELRKDLGALPTAIQEMFRYEPPLPFFHRHVIADVTLRGKTYPAGTTFGLLYASANRDPKVFESPDEFQIRRKPNRHLGFGRGLHLCLGNHLARLNMRVIFTTLLQRFETIQLAEDTVTYKTGLSVRGPKQLLVHLK